MDRHVGALRPGHVPRLRIFPQRRQTDRRAMLVRQLEQLVLDGENPFVRRGERDRVAVGVGDLGHRRRAAGSVVAAAAQGNAEDQREPCAADGHRGY